MKIVIVSASQAVTGIIQMALEAEGTLLEIFQGSVHAKNQIGAVKGLIGSYKKAGPEKILLIHGFPVDASDAEDLLEHAIYSQWVTDFMVASAVPFTERAPWLNHLRSFVRSVGVHDSDAIKAANLLSEIKRKNFAFNRRRIKPDESRRFVFPPVASMLASASRKR